MKIGTVDVPFKVLTWAVGIIFAAGGLAFTVKENRARLERIERNVDWLVQRELGAGPPAPVGWSPPEEPEVPEPKPPDAGGVIGLP